MCQYPYMRVVTLLVLFCQLGAWGAEKASLVRPSEYSFMSDASAAVALSTNLFAAAGDEDNLLRIYRRDQPGAPVEQVNLNRFLGVEGTSPEVDLEGAARVRERVFWISSHGQNRKAKERWNRHRFFATDIREGGNGPRLVPVGKPYEDLVRDLAVRPDFKEFQIPGASLRAPKETEALNIEGLAATPEGHLLIGFRNPVPGGKALLIPMLNPDRVIQGEKARFGEATLLDLKGRGVRDIVLWGQTYLLIAGASGSGGEFRIFRWEGGNSLPEELKVKHLNQYHPEAIIVYPDLELREVQLLSDDGGRLINGVPGKEVSDPRRRCFRSIWLQLQ